MTLYSQTLLEFVPVREISWLIHSHRPETPILPILPPLPTLVSSSLRGYAPIMQNKPNSQNPKTATTPCTTRIYPNLPPNPKQKKQTQSNPIPPRTRRHTISDMRHTRPNPIYRGEAGTNPIPPLVRRPSGPLRFRLVLTGASPRDKLILPACYMRCRLPLGHITNLCKSVSIRV
jgi:hypothetical protein